MTNTKEDFEDWDEAWEEWEGGGGVALVSVAQHRLLEARKREEEEDHLLTEALFHVHDKSTITIPSLPPSSLQSSKPKKQKKTNVVAIQRQKEMSQQRRAAKEREKKGRDIFGESSDVDELFEACESKYNHLCSM